MGVELRRNGETVPRILLSDWRTNPAGSFGYWPAGTKHRDGLKAMQLFNFTASAPGRLIM
jgi:hypothetical protein